MSAAVWFLILSVQMVFLAAWNIDITNRIRAQAKRIDDLEGGT